MAENKLELGTKTIKDLKTEVAALKKELEGCQAGSEQAAKKTQELNNAQNTLNAALKGAIDTAGKLDNSYNGLVSQMAKLKAEWKATNDEAKRTELGKQINALNDQLKKLDADVGVYSRNVGNYQSAFEALGGDGAKALMSGMNGIKTGLNSLKTAAGWIGLVVGIIMAIVGAMKKNEAAMNNLKKALAPFEGMINAINAAVGKLVEILVNQVVAALDKIAGFVEKILGKIGEWAGEHGLEGVAAACATVTEKMEEAKKIGEATVDNSLRQRQIAVQNAKSEAKLVELRAKFKELAEGSAEQMEIAQQIDEEQQKINARNVELAQKEYDLIKKKNAQSPSSTDDLNAENEAYIRLIQAQSQLKNQTSELAQVKKKQATAAANEAKKAAEEELKAEQKKNEEIKKLTESLSKWKSQQTEQGRLDALKAQYDAELALLVDNLDAQKQLTEKYEQEKAAIKKEYADKQQAEDAKNLEEKYAILQSAVTIVGEYTSQLDGTLGALGDLTNTLMEATLNLSKSIESGQKGWSVYAQMASVALGGVGQMLNGIAQQQDETSREGFEIKKKYEIAAATMNMISGIVGALAGIPSYIQMFAAMNIAAPAAGIALGSSLAAMVGAMGAANIAQISKQKYGSTSSASAAGVSGSALSSISAPVSYTSDVQGASTEREVEDTRVYVVESDITNTQRRVSTSESEARF